MTEMEKKIAQYLAENSKKNYSAESIAKNSDLYTQNILDSLSTLRLLSFLETEFSVKITPFKVVKKNFSTVSAISELVQNLKRD